ncbi:MAG: VOC family protein [Nannocystaceae bacterium]
MSSQQLFAYLRVNNAAEAIVFYSRAFGATEKFRLAEPSGRVGHAEIEIFGSTLMVSDEYPEHGITGPAKGVATGMMMHLHVDNADETIAQAVAAGAELVRPAVDHFYGERSGTVRDPFGHEWGIGHEIEKISNEEIQRRFAAMFEQT